MGSKTLIQFFFIAIVVIAVLDANPCVPISGVADQLESDESSSSDSDSVEDSSNLTKPTVKKTLRYSLVKAKVGVSNAFQECSKTEALLYFPTKLSLIEKELGHFASIFKQNPELLLWTGLRRIQGKIYIIFDGKKARLPFNIDEYIVGDKSVDSALTLTIKGSDDGLPRFIAAKSDTKGIPLCMKEVTQQTK